MSGRARFIVTESSGYRIGEAGLTGGKQKPITEVMVLDRDYCHNVVWSSLTSLQHYPDRYRPSNPSLEWATARLWPVERSRRYAADLASRLNSEDDS